MKRNLRLLLLMVLIGTSGIMSSCKDDQMESITLKRSGNLKVVVKNGEAPVANTQIRFYNADTENELDVVTTDEKGVIDFGKLNEGNYSVYFEVLEPQYSAISQEFQVVSGESKEYTVQVKDYVGNLTVFLLDEDYEEIVKEDLGIGVALVPYNDDFQKAFTNEEIIALASEKKYFGTEGKISFENIPSANYNIYYILADTIVLKKSSRYVDRLDEEYYSFYIDLNYERLFNKQSWSVTNAVDYYSSEAIVGFPLESLAFSRNSNSQTFTMKLANGIIVNGLISFNGGSYIDLYNYNSNNEDIDVYWSENSISFDEDGKVRIRFSYFSVDDYDTGESNFYDNYIEVTLE